jgi:hypothetical protein
MVAVTVPDSMQKITGSDFSRKPAQNLQGAMKRQAFNCDIFVLPEAREQQIWLNVEQAAEQTLQ